MPRLYNSQTLQCSTPLDQLRAIYQARGKRGDAFTFIKARPHSEWEFLLEELERLFEERQAGIEAPDHRENRTMAENLARRVPEDQTRININQIWELEYWCDELEVSESWLRVVVNKVGPMVADVKRYLRIT